MDGIIIINKPKNCTSHDIVQKAKRIFKQEVGHTGTLDPMATGVLPLLIGKGTLCSQYLINHDKIYKVKLTLGKKTDTADAEGKVIDEQNVDMHKLPKEKIEKVLQNFVGKQQQFPPIYSAIKIKGKKLYEYARKGEKIDIPPRQIEIYKIDVININQEKKEIQFEVHCSKGTYIRSLCEDISEKLGTIGYMSELQRIQVGNFNIEKAVTIEQLEENVSNEKWMTQNFINLETLFKEKEKIQLEPRKLEYFLNGVKLTQKRPDNLYRVYCENSFIGIGIIENELLKRNIIL